MHTKDQYEEALAYLEQSKTAEPLLTASRKIVNGLLVSLDAQGHEIEELREEISDLKAQLNQKKPFPIVTVSSGSGSKPYFGMGVEVDV